MKSHSLSKRGHFVQAPYLFILPAFLILFSVVVFPAIMTLRYSFSTSEGNFTLDNYSYLLSDKLFFSAFKNTLMFVGGSVAFQYIIGLGMALLLNLEFKGRPIFRLIALLPWMIPDVISGVIWKWTLDPTFGFLNDFLLKLGFIDEGILWLSKSHLALLCTVSVNIWRGFPFVMIILLAGLSSIPGQLYEAASVDGAKRIQRFLYITLPSLRGATIVALALATVWEFRRFGLIMAFTRGGPGRATEVFSTFVYKQYFEFFRFEYASATAIVISAIICVISLPYLYTIMRQT